jgi:hypothetical protein
MQFLSLVYTDSDWTDTVDNASISSSMSNLSIEEEDKNTAISIKQIIVILEVRSSKLDLMPQVPLR